MDKSEAGKKKYQELVKVKSPNSHIYMDSLKAFCVGGAICVLGQFFNDAYAYFGASKLDAATYTSITLIFFAVLLTGLGLYGKLGKFAGAGSVVPITGFANSVAAPAIEFKKEGYVLGVGAKMFVIAGPVIVFGLLTSSICGLIYYVIGVFFK